LKELINNLRKIHKDPLFLWFSINVGLLVLAFGLAGFGVVAAGIKILRSVIIAVSIVLILVQKKRKDNIFPFLVLILFTCSVFFILTFFSVDRGHSFGKLGLLIPFLIYLGLLTDSLKSVNTDVIIFKVASILQLWFFIPVITFYLNFNSVISYNFLIYGEVIGGFVSNQIGWSTVIFIISSLILRKHSNNRYTWFFIILAIFPLLISSSRSSYMGLVVCSVLFFLIKSNLRQKVKVSLFVLALVVIGNGLISDKKKEKLLITYRLSNKSDVYKLNKVDPRVQALRDVTSVFDNGYSMVGIGLNMPEKYTARVLKREVEGLHNSHLIALFGFGYIGFSFYLLCFILLPLIGYAIYGIRNGDVLYPLFFLLSSTEHNLGGGQFIFIPWIFLSFYYANKLLSSR
jgi:hypothetical protein